MTNATPDISGLRSDEIACASELLTVALQDDPGWMHVVPDVRRRQLALGTLTRVALQDAFAFGSVLGARDGDRLAGVAVWLPPGRYPMNSRRKLRTVPAMAALALRAPRDIRALSRFGASVDAVFPAEPVWYLQVLGVDPAMQRRGLGHRLLRPVLTEAERSGVACYLETAQPQNILFYTRVGFSVTGPPAPLYPDGPLMTRMTTPSRTLKGNLAPIAARATRAGTNATKLNQMEVARGTCTPVRASSVPAVAAGFAGALLDMGRLRDRPRATARRSAQALRPARRDQAQARGLRHNALLDVHARARKAGRRPASHIRRVRFPATAGAVRAC